MLHHSKDHQLSWMFNHFKCQWTEYRWRSSLSDRTLTCTDGCLLCDYEYLCSLSVPPPDGQADRALTWLSMCPALSWHWYLTAQGKRLRFQSHMAVCIWALCLLSLMQCVIVLRVRFFCISISILYTGFQVKQKCNTPLSVCGSH